MWPFKKKEGGGFSYINPEVLNRRAIIIFGLEAAAFLISLVIIIAVLSYFKILDVPRLLDNNFGRQTPPQNIPASSPRSGQISEWTEEAKGSSKENTGEYQVVFASEVKGYALKHDDASIIKLRNLLINLEAFRQYYDLNKASLGNKVTNIKIILTTEPQTDNRAYGPDKKIMSATSQQRKGVEMTVRVYIEPSILQDLNFVNENRTFELQMLRGIYRERYIDKNTMSKAELKMDQDFSKLLKGLLLANTPFVTIAKQ